MRRLLSAGARLAGAGSRGNFFTPTLTLPLQGGELFWGEVIRSASTHSLPPFAFVAEGYFGGGPRGRAREGGHRYECEGAEVRGRPRFVFGTIMPGRGPTHGPFRLRTGGSLRSLSRLTMRPGIRENDARRIRRADIHLRRLGQESKKEKQEHVSD